MKNLRIIALLLVATIFAFSSCDKDEDTPDDQSNTPPYYTSTSSLPKNAIVEEFTGVRCVNCPYGHEIVVDILANNPGRAFVVCLHPSNSNYTEPYAGDQEFRRMVLEPLYNQSYCIRNRAMPGAFVNRRVWNSERLLMRGDWVQSVDMVLTENSPINVGLTSSYDESTKNLSITVEIYFTETVTDSIGLVVVMSENELVAKQSGGTDDYVHKHTFREAFTDIWGDGIGESKTKGSLITKKFTFKNDFWNYIMSNCELIAYITNIDKQYEIITGKGAKVGQSTSK